MATLDVFAADGFSTAELAEAINIIPNQWGMIGDLGLFADKPIRTPAFQLEEGNGALQLVQSSPRGTAPTGADRGKRKLRNFSTVRVAQERRVSAEDVSGIRAFGSETELAQVQDEVNARLLDIRANLDITREYHRAGALAGVIKDADAETITDLFTEFGVTQKVVDFDLGTGATDHLAKAREVARHIQVNLKGDVMTGVGALCSPEFWDKLMAIDDFKDAYKYYESITQASPLRDDVRNTPGGFRWQGINWMEYLGEADVPQEAGTSTARRFITAGDARFFPMGTRRTFATFNAPADYMETVNTPGQPFYAKMAPDPTMNRYVMIEGQSNLLPVCMRPAVLVRGHSSS
jgi:hypothetical protein